MNETRKVTIFIFFFSILILNVEVCANHHRYNQLVSLCKAHRGAALIVPECMKYIYGDEAKYKIKNILKEYFEIKNNGSVSKKEKLINNFLKENFNAEGLAKG